jgi:hypothetical protein
LDNYTKPPLRARKTHEANVRGVMHPIPRRLTVSRKCR